MPGSHSLFAPSKSVTWMRCHASLAASKGKKPSPENEPAARGTAKHMVSEWCLTQEVEPEKWAGMDVFVPKRDGTGQWKFTVDDEFITHVHAYVDAIRREVADVKLYEVELDTSPILGVAGQGGTSDCLMMKFSEDMLEIHDAKFGWHRIRAKGNEQLLNYAVAALAAYDLTHDWKKVKVAIHQPQHDHYDEHIYDRSEVEDFGRIARQAAMAGFYLYEHGDAEAIRGAMNPGAAQCEWCPIRGSCPARNEAIVSMFPKNSPDDRFISVELDDAQLADARLRVDEIESWCGDVKSEMTKRALAGNALPGFKVVRGKKSPRFWIDPGSAENALFGKVGAAAFQPRELISPTAAEKLLKKEGYADVALYVSQKPGSLKVVRTDEPGEPVTVSTMDFAAVGNVEELI